MREIKIWEQLDTLIKYKKQIVALILENERKLVLVEEKENELLKELKEFALNKDA